MRRQQTDKSFTPVLCFLALVVSFQFISISRPKNPVPAAIPIPIPTSPPGLNEAIVQAYSKKGWDCGKINLSNARDPKIANACVAKAVERRLPFRIKLNLSNSREIRLIYILGDGHGKILLIRRYTQENAEIKWEEQVSHFWLKQIDGKQFLLWQNQHNDFYGY